MQKAIAKYGLAAHLALLAVAPLFLFPFFSDELIAGVQLWIALPAAVWILMEPSLRSGEMLHVARRRVLKAIVADPLFWIFLVLVVLAGIRALNTGIALAYDAENLKWHLAPSALPLFPGCVESAGYLPFAGVVSLLVIVLGCRHALGRSARMAFLFVASALAGLAATIAIASAFWGNAIPRAAFSCDVHVSSFVGVAFALHLMGGTVALVAAFERQWRAVIPAFAFAIGGTAAGLFVFSPVFESAAFMVAEVVLLCYVFAYSARVLPAAGEFKILVISGISLTLGGLLVMTMLPPEILNARLASFKSFTLFAKDFNAVRSTLSDIACKSWFAHLWIGTGLGTFPLDFRFAAVANDWALLRRDVVAIPNGWWQLLAERGIVGALSVLIPVGFLAFTFLRRSFEMFRQHALPHPACLLAPVVLVGLAVAGTFDCSFLRVDVMMVSGAFLAISASSLVRSGRG